MFGDNLTKAQEALMFFGVLFLGVIAICIFVAILARLDSWWRQVKNHQHATALEARIVDLEAQLAVARDGAPYRAPTPTGSEDKP